MDVLIGLGILVFVLAFILIKSERQYKKDQAKSKRMAAIREAQSDREEKELTVREKKRAKKFAKEEKIEGFVH